MVHYHLPGLFEFYELYKVFLPIFKFHREYFYEWCEIGSVYGAPADSLWGGGRVGFGEASPSSVAALMAEYGISSRLTFSNSLITSEHLSDAKCNRLCSLFEHNGDVPNGVIVHSDLLASYIRSTYPDMYLVSSTTKVITDRMHFEKELSRAEFSYVVPDFRLNKELFDVPASYRGKVEFLCNECCDFGCSARKACYENVSRKSLGEDCPDHVCAYGKPYRFSAAMKNPGFIGVSDITDVYSPLGFSEFKIEGRSLGSAIVLEFLLYYMTKPEYQLKVREEVYLDSSLDLF